MSILDISDVLLEAGLSAAATDEERAIVQTAITRAEGAVKRFLKYDPTQQSRTEYYPQRDYQITSRESIWEADANNAYIRRFAESATDELLLEHLPIRTGTLPRVFIDYDGRGGARSGSFAADTEKTYGTDFWPNVSKNDSNGDAVSLDGILNSVGLWPVERGAVKVIYTAGYSVAELRGNDLKIDASPIYRAALDEAVRLLKKAFINRKTSVGFLAGPLTSERLGDYGYNLDASTASRLFASATELTGEAKEALQPFVNYGILAL